jgi:hypothetical protein
VSWSELLHDFNNTTYMGRTENENELTHELVRVLLRSCERLCFTRNVSDEFESITKTDHWWIATSRSNHLGRDTIVDKQFDQMIPVARTHITKRRYHVTGTIRLELTTLLELVNSWTVVLKTRSLVWGYHELQSNQSRIKRCTGEGCGFKAIFPARLKKIPNA